MAAEVKIANNHYLAMLRIYHAMLEIDPMEPRSVLMEIKLILYRVSSIRLFNATLKCLNTMRNGRQVILDAFDIQHTPKRFTTKSIAVILASLVSHHRSLLGPRVDVFDTMLKHNTEFTNKRVVEWKRYGTP